MGLTLISGSPGNPLRSVTLYHPSGAPVPPSAPLVVSRLLPVAAADNPGTQPVTADLILINGRIWTGNRQQSQAEALAVWRGRILAIGTRVDLQALIGPSTRVLDLKGRRVVSGFYD